MTDHERALREVIDAWDALPGDRNYSRREIQKWLVDDMWPAIEEARRVLERPRPVLTVVKG